MLAQDSPVSHSIAGPVQLDGERNRPLSNQGEVNLSTFSDSAPDPGAVLPPHHGTTITDLQDLVERHDLAPFVRIALAEYLRANHLPSITYYELSLGEQAKIQSRARELQLRRNTVTTSTKAATHTPGPWQAVEWSCHAPTTIVASGRTILPNGTLVIAECGGQGRDTDETLLADARLMAGAPAVDLILQMCELGVARLEVCSHEFCFNGLRYSIGEERDWDMILNVIGWDTARKAIQQARSQGSALPVACGHEGAVE